jgi:hypothetical protein
MNAKELADKFNAKTVAAVVERERQSGIAAEHIQKRAEDIEYCKRAMESNVLPFLAELKQHLGEGQFTFAPQIDIQDHKPVGVSFKIGDSGTTSISTALGNIITRAGDGGTKKRALPMSIRLMRSPISQIRVTSRRTRSPNWLKW